MSALPPQVVQLTCPSCRTPLRAQIFTLIDVGRQPELKSYLLSGQLNLVACPNCGAATMIAAPLIYHDPAKQLFLVHFPQQLHARPEDQERFIGDATSALMRSLPADTPKGYLFAPRHFLTLNSLVEAVLEADGISREMVESQRKRVDLISRLAEAYEQGEEQLAALVAQHQDELDAEFFATLSAFAEAGARGDQAESAQILVQLRDKLVELTGFEDDMFADHDIPLDEALTRLLEAPDEDLGQAIIDLRPAIDYSFFEALTAQIEAAEQRGDQATAEQLTTRRTLILETVERIDKQAQELFDAGTTVLQAALDADDPEPVLRANVDKLSEAFMLVLDANQQAAERAGALDVVERLDAIRALTLDIVRESLSPEDRLLDDMLRAESQQEASGLLHQNRAMVSTAFVKRINKLADQLDQDGQKEVSERMRQLGREAGAMLF